MFEGCPGGEQEAPGGQGCYGCWGRRTWGAGVSDYGATVGRGWQCWDRCHPLAVSCLVTVTGSQQSAGGSRGAPGGQVRRGSSPATARLWFFLQQKRSRSRCLSRNWCPSLLVTGHEQGQVHRENHSPEVANCQQWAESGKTRFSFLSSVWIPGLNNVL